MCAPVYMSGDAAMTERSRVQQVSLVMRRRRSRLRSRSGACGRKIALVEEKPFCDEPGEGEPRWDAGSEGAERMDAGFPFSATKINLWTKRTRFGHEAAERDSRCDMLRQGDSGKEYAGAVEEAQFFHAVGNGREAQFTEAGEEAVEFLLAGAADKLKSEDVDSL